MLTLLCVSDLALFERAELTFGGGFNAITGETGAGKSLLLDALEFLLGRTPRAGLVRAGATEARVTGCFSLDRERAGARLTAWLEENVPGVLEDSNGEAELELVLERSLAAAGRTSARVNERPVTRKALRELSSMLVEIHGQNDHQKLLEPAEQRHLLDVFGGHEAALDAYRERRAAWLALVDRLRRFDQERAERLQRLDLVRHQAEELERAAPRVGEADELRSERERLRNADELGRRIGGAVVALYDDDGAAIDVVRRSVGALGEWEERVTELREPAGELREALVWLEQAEARLRDFVESVDASPERLDEVENRLAELERLERKYRCSADELATRASSLSRELESLESEDVDRDRLAAELVDARRTLVTAAGKLTSARKRAATRLQRGVEASLADLGMAGTRIEVRLSVRTAELEVPERADDAAHEGVAADGGPVLADARLFGPEGCDRIEFMLGANPGEPLAPLQEVASGGEAARLMLALRSALALRQSIPTLVFDEVDAGVGGRLAPRIGAHLAKLGESHQILCVTHLPAVAAVADTHLRVAKEVAGGRTTTRVVELAGDLRVAEVADMIAGGGDQDTARAEARRLLRL